VKFALLGILQGTTPSLRAAVAAILLALLGAFGLWQWWLDGEARASTEALRAERTVIAARLSRQLEALRGELVTAGERALAQAGADAGLAVLAEGARRLLGEGARVEAFTPELREVLDGDLTAFGFARANLLLEARQGRASVQLLERDRRKMLGLAVRLPAEGEPSALILAELPLDRLTRVLRDAYRAGYLSLRAGEQAQIVIAEVGDERLAERMFSETSPVPGTTLRLVLVPPPSPAWLEGATGLWLGVLALGAAVLVPLALLGRLRWPGRGSPEAEVTLAEALAREPPRELPARSARAPGAREGAREESTEEGAPAARERRGEALERSIFRAYDIRGVVGRTLTESIARSIGQAIGTVVRERGLREVVVGRDGRLSSPRLSGALISGLRRAGCDVIDIGAVPSPVVYFATHHLQTGCGVAVTGSHNPPEYNGFKMMVGGETLAEEAIQDLYRRIVEHDLAEAAEPGGIQAIDLRGEYVERITSDIQTERSLRVVVDAGNGIAGELAPQIISGIGCDPIPLNCEVDGTFPNHHPDPSDPENLVDLITTVKQLGADLGIAFDGDGDRLGVVTARGHIVHPDRLLMLFARDLLLRNPGAVVIYDVKCTGRLASEILRYGGSPVMWRTGHSLIKAKMKELDAELAGEMSGHFFFKERWFGFDDALYAAARLLEILASEAATLDELIAELPGGVSTPELRVSLAEGEQYAFIERFQREARFEGARISQIDGLRADWDDGWGLVRASNTTPVLVLRFEGDDAEALARIQGEFRRALLAVRPDLALPF
jgi:phosphomannomutase/phosphoglucomutase